MFRHCVMLKWVDGVTADAKAAVAAGLDELAELEMVASYRHGPDAGLRDDNWDYAIVGDFADREAYSSYATDESHQRLLAGVIAPNISARAAVQFEI